MPILSLRVAILLMLALAAFVHPAGAQAPRENAIRTALAAETMAPAPGETVTIAIRMTPDPGWHGYWTNPGDAGVPDEWVWDVPDGVSVGDLRYPVPQRLVISGIMNYVFERDYALLAEVTIPADAAPGTRLPLRVSGNWLACTAEICVPESGAMTLTLTVGDGSATRDRATFDRYRAELPRPLGSEAVFAVTGDMLRIGIPFPRDADVSDPYFFAETDRVLDYAAEQRVTRRNDMLIVEVLADSDAARASEVRGLLKIGEADGLLLRAVPGTVPPAGTPVAVEERGDDLTVGTILLALGGAILGGLLLNIMPCVFPILSLKALSLARAGESDAAARKDALAYTAGVVLVCVALGVVLLLLRAGGQAAGWAFQLQDPRMILLLLLLISAITFNLAGLFEVPALSGGGRLAGRDDAVGSFFTGALAAFVATPCTGPFMAAALGAALVVPAAAALAIFAGLGIGLALPFLLIAYVPSIRSRLPKPGPWLATFRKVMSIPMALTALALVWVLGQQTGVDGITLGIAAVLIMAGLLWWAGGRQRKDGSGRLLVLPVLAVVALAMVFLPTERPALSADLAVSGALGAEPFDEARLEELRAGEGGVFVYFTADWCITCKANEAGALASDAVAAHFAENDIAVMVGDWTTGDPVIGRFLERHGRSGVPLYLWYAPGEEAEILPQILTVGRLTAL
ncbi:MAG: protein-disulfide reductase DsbD family protein [Parasphingopyxis sp.]|uniref:protein-disulfide reductase DsbD family protein n=1 Tax=Parasphingopyxis sp. TaxID=1920299 RepID=UPI0032EF093B